MTQPENWMLAYLALFGFVMLLGTYGCGEGDCWDQIHIPVEDRFDE